MQALEKGMKFGTWNVKNLFVPLYNNTEDILLLRSTYPGVMECGPETLGEQNLLFRRVLLPSS